MMNNKRKSNLWLLFVVIVLAVTIMTFIILGAAMAILFALGIIPTQQQLAPFPFIMLIGHKYFPYYRPYHIKARR